MDEPFPKAGPPHMTFTDLLLLFVFPTLIIYSGVSDLLRMTISNRVSLGLALAFVVMALLTGMPVATIAWHLAAGFSVLVVTFTCFACGWIGGGDAKIAAATALWLGFGQLFPYLATASLFGGILTIALLRARTLPLPDVAARQPWIARLHRLDTGIPYGIALAAAALVVYPSTSWMTAVGV
jgi:prepilin peptidase CpaA